MGGTAVVDLGIVAAVIIIVGGILLYITRKTHIISWRFGIFFESEERFNGESKETQRNKEPLRSSDEENNDGGES